MHFDEQYRVRLRGDWIVVPDAAVVMDPNRFEPAAFIGTDGSIQIRRFMPGAPRDITVRAHIGPGLCVILFSIGQSCALVQ
jgi:hypothetical protein